MRAQPTAPTIASPQSSAIQRSSAIHQGGQSAHVQLGGGLWWSLLAIVLAGYALFGKGWAYVGLPPIYIGEITLLIGVVWFLFNGKLDWRLPHLWLLLAMAAWGAFCTVPYLGKYRIDALRDAVLWGYAAFAIVVCSYVLAQPARLKTMLRWFGQFSLVYIWVMPLLWLFFSFYHDRIPQWPWADTPVIFLKGGDILVHYAAIVAYWVLGLGGRPLRPIHTLGIVAAVGMIGATSRSGLLAFAIVFAVCLMAFPLHRLLWRIMAAGVCGLLLLMISQTQIDLESGADKRSVSTEQLIENVVSVFGSSRAADLDNTKAWRLQWWGQILDYTVNGPYFWTGKGFGVNLSIDDGFQVEDHRGTLQGLRSPHNGHMTMLARSGVPGFLLWTLVHASWAISLLACLVQSWIKGQSEWMATFGFLLAYWIALMVNGSFDVYFEGPMGGIWLWTVYGLGLAACCLYKRAETQEAIAGTDVAVGLG